MYVHINETGKNTVFRTVNNAVTDKVCVRKIIVFFRLRVLDENRSLVENKFYHFSQFFHIFSIYKIIS